MTDRERLLGLLDVFEAARDDFAALVRDLDDREWELPTDLEGWTVHDVVSHTAHLEAVLAGAPEETVAVPQGLPHVTSLMDFYTEQGVIARRDHTREQLLAELAAATGQRLGETRANPPRTPPRRAPKTPGDIGWSWQTLLANRPLDVWMHEQDIRRATDRPGNLDSVPARHVVGLFGSGLGYVWGKKVGAGVGQTAAVEVTDLGKRFLVTVGEDGRGTRAAADATPDTTLRLGTEAFIVLSGGRRDPDSQPVEIAGDEDLGDRCCGAPSRSPREPDRELDAGGDPRPARPTDPGHRRHRRDRHPDRARAGPGGCRGGARRPLAGQADPHPGRARGRGAGCGVPRADRGRLRPGVRTSGGRGGSVVRPAGRAGQQRRRDGAAVPAHRRRLRAPARHQPPRAVPADRAAAPAAGRERRGRVVAVASQGHRLALRAPLGDPRRRPMRYSRWLTYARTKLADLLFTYELDRRLHEKGLPVTALAAHPGYSATELMGSGRRAGGETRRAEIMQGAFELVGQPAHHGRLAEPDGGDGRPAGSTYVGPEHYGQLAGPPTVVALDAALPRPRGAAPAVGDQRDGDRDPLPLSMADAEPHEVETFLARFGQEPGH